MTTLRTLFCTKIRLPAWGLAVLFLAVGGLTYATVQRIEEGQASDRRVEELTYLVGRQSIVNEIRNLDHSIHSNRLANCQNAYVRELGKALQRRASLAEIDAIPLCVDDERLDDLERMKANALARLDNYERERPEDE